MPGVPYWSTWLLTTTRTLAPREHFDMLACTDSLWAGTAIPMRLPPACTLCTKLLLMPSMRVHRGRHSQLPLRPILFALGKPGLDPTVKLSALASWAVFVRCMAQHGAPAPSLPRLVQGCPFSGHFVFMLHMLRCATKSAS